MLHLCAWSYVLTPCVADGAVGSTAQSASGALDKDGAAGSTAQGLSGALDKNGAIGKQFTKDGAIGGTLDSILGKK